MVKLEDVSSLLQAPAPEQKVPVRTDSTYKPLHSFALDKQRSYKQQYGDMYFLRLAKIKPAVEEVASKAWDGTEIGGELAKRVDRVLDVRQGELCWVAGTVYMDMRLKPNILEDVSKDRWLSAPISSQKYYSDDGSDQIMLEDDSGRVRLVGELLNSIPLVTGCIIAVMGTENTNGEFEVIDLKVPDLAPQPERWALSKAPSAKSKSEDTDMTDSPSPNGGKKVAIVSGLSFSGTDASAYNPLPSQLFDEFVAELLPSIPVTLLPGARDPANASYPQQPIHTAMFPLSRAYASDPGAASTSQPGWFDTVTNPWEAEIEGWRILGTGGQNVDDVFKYVESDDRLGMMEAMCRWRCCAPTAPDTLWSYPFQEDDPFVLKSCPHVYFVGCQPEFATKVIHGPDGQSVRLIAVPSFSKTKEFVLVDTETLEVTKIKITSR
ncbi:DNA polymerase III (delta) subunit Pol31 [Trichoderma guizhouense]|uniref:DNA-directed DNA polymerase n=1 Tax=Trichoderma guizhouense TaxID=1491466 RepID=A0A1T3CG37_9HYPO|nr:DNA polymerase III (delta) subunit Pol31 [Trichoderma guizhouense]